MHVVIVGNGVAGTEAALVVRAREPDWRITVVSEESDHFFSRTALMYVLAGQLSHRDIEPLERDLAARLRLERVRRRVVGLDAGGRALILAGGDRLPFDRLLIATGSRPRPGPWPGSDLRGVGHFVTLQDLEWLEAEVHGGPSGERPPRPDAHLTGDDPPGPYAPRAVARRGGERRPVVIGGGLIGIEVVETLLAAGMRPVFVIREPWFWPIALNAAEAAWIADALRHHGVDVRLGEEVERLEPGPDGAVAAVHTSGGRIPADLVVVAIGVVPHTEWLAEAGLLDAGGGVRVDAGLQTDLPGVWAAGDCAAVRWADGRVRPEQLWYTARDQGRVAGRAIVGDAVRYERGPWYNAAKLMDIEYTTVGQVDQGIAGEQSWVHEERGAVASTTRVVHVDGRVIGFNFLGRRWDHEVCVRWIEERRSLRYVLDHLDEARFDTEFVPPLRIPAAARP